MTTTHDAIVIGSGVAGLMAALTLASETEGPIALFTKGLLTDGCSLWARGGIAAAIAPNDSPQTHVNDTLAVGRDLCDPQAVRVLVEEIPGYIRQLQNWGIKFDTDEKGNFQLGLEAAHSHARVVHARNDATGLELETVLIKRLGKTRVHVFEHCEIVELLINQDNHCIGVLVRNHQIGKLTNVIAKTTILASGGAGQLWRTTTNPTSATGDGVALAYAAGAEITNMEFMQFHPTALAVNGAPSALITEAIRGEGAWIVNRDGERFVDELAPRDVVAQAIWQELQSDKTSKVYLDCRHLANDLEEKFPTVTKTCQQNNLDIKRDLIPIQPAAHYQIGGVKTDIDGRTNLVGLYACGEVASTGVHGANRLASNSLAEAIVFAVRSAKAIAKDLPELAPTHTANYSQKPPTSVNLNGNLKQWRQELASIMWEGAGIIRTEQGLSQALSQLDAMRSQHPQESSALTASLVCQSALARKESRGTHLRGDYATTNQNEHGVWIMQQQKGIYFGNCA